MVGRRSRRQAGRWEYPAGRTLGVSGQTLDNWVKAEAAGRLRDVQGKAVTAEQQEIARLKAELSRVRMERDILKTYGPPRRQGVNSGWHDRSASTYPVSKLKPWPRWISAQSDPHKSAGAEHHI